MKLFVAALLFASPFAVPLVSAAPDQQVEGTMSPQGLCIIHVSTPKSDAYRFWNTKLKKYAGSVLPPDQDDLSNLQFVADWNPKGTRLALLYYYSTKLSDFYLYTTSADGMVNRADFKCPDSSDVYANVKGHTWSLSQSSGESCNSLGPWTDDNTVRLICGDSKDVYDKQNQNLGTLTLLVTFKVHFMDYSTKVSDEKLIGPFSDADRDTFLKQWGDQYQ
jgi:hypothetical protein